MNHEIAAERLHNQFIARRLRADPARLVARLGAVQAQEYPFAKWGLALRLAAPHTDASIDAACDAGHILRTHVLRPTWHFIARDDIRWMLALTGPRVQRTVIRWTRREGIDATTLRKAASIFERALSGGVSLTRADLGARLARSRIALSAAQLAFVTMYAELERVVCSGPRSGKQFTYALLSDRAPAAPRLPRDEALSTLTRRYFSSHGPATIRDFVWWSGLTVADTRRGLEMNRATRQTIDGVDYWRIGARGGLPAGHHVELLPIYDEYLVAYRDRAAVPHGPGTLAASLESVTFRHAFISRGQVAGTWNVNRAAGRCDMRVTPMRRLSPAEKAGVADAAARFARFLGCPVSVTFG